MATPKKIQLIFDINSNDVTIATDKTLSLTQQVRIFKRELQGIPEGSREFEILRNKINDTNDSLARVNTKSGEFFNTLSLLPGPIGDVSNQLDSSIGLLKTFSGFSLKDIGNQFKGLGKDLAGIFDNFFGLNKEAEKLADSNSNLSKSTKDAAESSKLFDTAAGAQIVSTEEAVNSSNNLTEAVKSTTSSFEENLIMSQKLATGDAEVIDGRIVLKESTLDLSNATKLLTKEELAQIPATEANAVKYALKNKIVTEATLKQRANTTATQIQTIAENQNTGSLVGNTAAGTVNVATTGAITVAQRVATVSTRIWTGALIALKAVLVSLGIGLLISLLSSGASLLMDWYKGTDKAAEGSDKAAGANDKLAKAQEKVRKETERSITAIEAETKAQLTRAKIAGKTEEELFDIAQNGIKKRISVLEAANKRLKGAEQNYNDEIIKLRREFSQNQLEFQLEQQKEREKGRIAELDALIKLEINSATTDRDNLKKLLDQRLQLELSEGKKSQAEKEALRLEYDKKLEDAIDADEKKRNDRILKGLDASAQLEIDKRNTDLATLQEFYNQKLAIELKNEELSESEKQLLRDKYSKLANEAIKKDTLERLQNELAAASNNSEEQLKVFNKLQEALNSGIVENATERAQLTKQYGDSILQTIDTLYQTEIDAADVKYGQLKRFSKEYYDDLDKAQAASITRLDAALKSGAISQGEYNKRIIGYSKARQQTDQEEAASKVELAQVVGNALGALSQLAGEETAAGKALAIAQATIDTYAGATKALAAYPPPFNFIAAGAVVVAGLLNVKKILSVKVPNDQGGAAGSTQTPPPPPIQVNAVKRAQGGLVTGPGGSQSDSIPAQLSNGEYVINARSTKLFGPMLDTINSYGSLPQFSSAGLGAPGSNLSESRDTLGEAIARTLQESPIKTYVTGQEISNQQQFDRVVRQRSLI